MAFSFLLGLLPAQKQVLTVRAAQNRPPQFLFSLSLWAAAAAAAEIVVKLNRC